MRKNESKKKTVFAFLLIFIIGMVGVYFAYNYLKDNPSNGIIRTLPKEEVFRSSLQDNLSKQNIFLHQIIDLELDTAAEQASTEPYDQLDTASNELKQIMLQVYDDAKSDDFTKIWQDQNTYFVNYTVSKINNDTTGVEVALGDLQGIQNRLTDFFGDIEGFDKDGLKNAVASYRTAVLSHIDSHLNTTVTVDESDNNADEQVKSLADVIVDTIYL